MTVRADPWADIRRQPDTPAPSTWADLTRTQRRTLGELGRFGPLFGTSDPRRPFGEYGVHTSSADSLRRLGLARIVQPSDVGGDVGRYCLTSAGYRTLPPAR